MHIKADAFSISILEIVADPCYLWVRLRCTTSLFCSFPLTDSIWHPCENVRNAKHKIIWDNLLHQSKKEIGISRQSSETNDQPRLILGSHRCNPDFHCLPYFPFIKARKYFRKDWREYQVKDALSVTSGNSASSKKRRVLGYNNRS